MFSREFKLEAVKLVRDRGVTAAQTSRDLDVHADVLGKWVRELETDPAPVFPGHGQVKPDQVHSCRRIVASLTRIPSRRRSRLLGLPPAACAKWPKSCACRDVQRA